MSGCHVALETMTHPQILPPVTLLLGLYLRFPCHKDLHNTQGYVLSRVWLCNPDPMGCTPPGSPVHGVLQARILETSAVFYSRGSSRPRGWAWVSCISCIGKRGFFTTEPPGKPISIFDRYQILWNDQMPTPNALHYQLANAFNMCDFAIPRSSGWP